MPVFYIGESPLTISTVSGIVENNQSIALSDVAKNRIENVEPLLMIS